jgi:hypothetical protein
MNNKTCNLTFTQNQTSSVETGTNQDQTSYVERVTATGGPAIHHAIFSLGTMTSIQSAIEFLNDPKVAGAPLTQQIAFLESKGLSPSEIQAALASVNGSVPFNQSAHSPYGFTDFTLAAASIVGLGYFGTLLVQVA